MKEKHIVSSVFGEIRVRIDDDDDVYISQHSGPDWISTVNVSIAETADLVSVLQSILADRE